jgi:hypothetical protein
MMPALKEFGLLLNSLQLKVLKKHETDLRRLTLCTLGYLRSESEEDKCQNVGE